MPDHPVCARFRKAVVPELAYVEVAQAMLTYVRAGLLETERARIALGDLRALPFEARPLRELALVSLDAAIGSGTSAYDAVYLVLSAQLDAVLVTADRRLAELAGRAELVA